MSFIEPRAWCALERDSVLTTPYIRDEDDGDEEDDDA
jgi:hypothetical protein